MSGPTRYQLWYGRDEPPARRPILRAGAVTAILDGADLRNVNVNGVELVQRVYVAVRDAPWNTIPAELSDWVLQLDADRFRVAFRASHRHDDIHFDWAGVIEGTPEGIITYEMDGLCRGSFTYSKIGFNIHHALEGSVGRPYRAQAEDGELRGVLPADIDPQRIVDGTLSGMFEPYSELAIEVADGLEAVVALEGDLMELQDHRNWTDANFKSYGTPLALGFPFDSRDGQRIRQKLTLGYAGATPAPRRRPDPEIHVGAAAVGPLPALGLGMASHAETFTDREADLLRVLRPAHLRVDLRLADPGHPEMLGRAAREAGALGSAIELAIHAHAAHEEALATLASRLATLRSEGVAVARVLVYPAADGFSAFVSTTPASLVKLVRDHLEPATGPIVFAGGTDQSFADINRDRPAHPALTGVCFSISPTVHAADDRSIVENLTGQAEVVRMARSFSGGRAICVSPVTIATRNGPYPAGPSSEGDLPPAVDVRQVSLMGAAWTVGSIAALASAAADSVTYYETTGWRGVLERALGSPMPERFPSRGGQVFPLYHVLADVADWAPGTLLEVHASHPTDVVALAMAGEDGRRHALVANVTSEPQRAVVRGLGERLQVRVLDEASAQTALADPRPFRSGAGAVVEGSPEGVWLALGPFAVARLDTVDVGGDG